MITVWILLYFFGGLDEGVFQSYDVINGWGASFLGENVGQGVGVLEYLNEFAPP